MNSSPPNRSTGLVAHERYFWHDTGRGFCIFGNTVLRVRHAQRAHGVGRAARARALQGRAQLLAMLRL